MKAIACRVKWIALIVGYWGFECPSLTGDQNGSQTFGGTVRASAPWPNTTMKGVVVTLDGSSGAYICYDTDLLRVSLAWTGAYLNFGNYQHEVHHPQPPEVAGVAVFATKPYPGWSLQGSFLDVRDKNQGPLPRAWGKYRGLYVHKDRVILSYAIGTANVLEMPTLGKTEGGMIFGRAFEMDKVPGESLVVCDLLDTDEINVKGPSLLEVEHTVSNVTDSACLAVGILGAPGAKLEVENDRVLLALSECETNAFDVLIWVGSKANVRQFEDVLAKPVPFHHLGTLCNGGPARWTNEIVRQGSIGSSAGPYAIDNLSEPLPNPWGAKTFFTGLDFLPDGRAVICTFHGDVWLVSGIDADLRHVRWKRFAAGLFQPLGIKVVDQSIYVTCRDQLTRLRDLNADDEADFYENFNNDAIVTDNYHEFCMDLQTDAEGNFYYGKSVPMPLNIKSPHQGCLLKVSCDGSRLEVYATGFRAPNGIGVGPHGEITASDNEGNWVPASKLNWVKKGSFYGVVPAAHRKPEPTNFERPMCWLPVSTDNSSGGQVWVTGDQWGPFKDHLLFLSYGKGALFHVMQERIGDQVQAAMTQFPLRFNSGIMRARFNARDGQLYVCGMRGWQTTALDDGGLYRVRYTGHPVYMPCEFHVFSNGVAITFTTTLNVQAANDLQNYRVEQWNYKWSQDYGSPELSTTNPALRLHDPVSIKAVQLSSDKKTIFLTIPEIKPVDQMKIRFRISATDRTPIDDQILCTILAKGADCKFGVAR